MADFSNSILLIHRLQANIQPITEDISAQESNTLGVFCNINDVEVSLYLLPYVCFGVGGAFLSWRIALNTELLKPIFLMAHAFITVVANIRIRLLSLLLYCTLTFSRLKLCVFTQVLWTKVRTEHSLQRGDLQQSTVKEPLDTTLHFDKEGLDLAFQYSVSPTLWGWLMKSGNDRLHTFNDLCNKEPSVSGTECPLQKNLQAGL